MTLTISLNAGYMASNMIRLLQPIILSLLISAKRISILFFLTIVSLTSFGQSAATKVSINTHPVLGSTNGSLMSVQPVVEIRNASDQLVTTSSAQVEIAIASGTGGILGGATRINAVNGIATFTDLTFSGVSNESYIFQFKSEPIIASESFAYTGGSSLTGSNGGVGWSGAWFGPNSAFPDLIVDAAGLTYANFAASGGRASYSSGFGGDAGRLLAAPSNASHNIIWLAFLGNYTQQGGGFNNLRLMTIPSTLTGAIGGNDNYANWSILNSLLNATTFTSTPLNGNTRLALLKINYTAGSSSLWMDPAVLSFDGTQTPSMTVNFAPVFDQIGLYNRNDGVSTDEITLASTYKAALRLEQNLTADFSIATVLPVKWGYFTASCDDAYTLIKWSTTNETESSRFIVEKSMDALSWSAIGSVQSTGNSGGEQRYLFKDSAFSLTSYYRLRQVDFNGNAYLSKIVVTNCETTADRMLRVFPNPTSGDLQIAGAQAGSHYKLIDVQGHAVKTGIILSSPTTISLSGLPEGNYFLKMSGYNSQPVHVMKAKR